MNANEMPMINAPNKIYWRLLPHLDLVLSEIKPIKGSVMASKSLGIKNIMPQ